MKRVFEVGDLVRWTLRGSGSTNSTGSRDRGLGIILDRMDRTPTSVREHYFFDFTTEEEAPHAYKVHWYGVDENVFDNKEWCVTKELVPA